MKVLLFEGGSDALVCMRFVFGQLVNLFRRLTCGGRSFVAASGVDNK